jgi:hypothetical protein
MIAVADASPICYLVLIGEIELLPMLFSKVLVPPAVIEELLAEGAPAAVRSWASAPPTWVEVRETPTGATPDLGRLQPGERAAISLAESTNADLVLVDEKAARLAAAKRGLRVTGVLGVLAEAANLSRVDLPAAIDRLTKTSFRSSPALLKSVLERRPRR